MRFNTKKILSLLLIAVFLCSTTTLASSESDDEEAERFFLIKNAIKEQQAQAKTATPTDLIEEDAEITITIKEIRAFDTIDSAGKPSFYVKIFVNGMKYTSEVWRQQDHIKPNWQLTCAVPDNQEWVDIRIQLWDRNPGRDTLCDLSRNYYGTRIDDKDIELFYSIKTGHWDGEDYIYHDPILADRSGYGRLNGCDDNSVYQNDRDCELYFDITQNDPDGDGIPYWIETQIYGTDPTVDDTGLDEDDDGAPIEWEHKWGHYLYYNHSSQQVEHAWKYHPFRWENHSEMDPDEDGLDNVEEYMTSQWGSDPFRKDIFLEIDKMELGPNGEGQEIPDASIYLLKVPFAKQNILLHIDVEGNELTLNGADTIPFDEESSRRDLQEYYLDYFLHGDLNNWRKGVFHYALIVYKADWAGFVFHNGVDSNLDCLQISTYYHETMFLYKNRIYNALRRGTFSIPKQREKLYAGVIMHELGHTLGIFNSNTPGCDARGSASPLNIYFWKYQPYKSVMNYRYVYGGFLDYSDGSRGKNDFDDWDFIDLTLFQRSIW